MPNLFRNECIQVHKIYKKGIFRINVPDPQGIFSSKNELFLGKQAPELLYICETGMSRGTGEGV